jgi:hypothetical protein
MTRNELDSALDRYIARVLLIGLVAALLSFAFLAIEFAYLQDLLPVVCVFFSRLGSPWGGIASVIALQLPVVLVLITVFLLQRRAVRQTGATCPNCRRSVLFKWRQIFATGLCPYCGVPIIEDTGGEYHRRVSYPLQIIAVGIVSVMVLLGVWRFVDDKGIDYYSESPWLIPVIITVAVVAGVVLDRIARWRRRANSR